MVIITHHWNLSVRPLFLKQNPHPNIPIPVLVKKKTRRLSIEISVIIVILLYAKAHFLVDCPIYCGFRRMERAGLHTIMARIIAPHFSFQKLALCMFTCTLSSNGPQISGNWRRGVPNYNYMLGGGIFILRNTVGHGVFPF